MSYEARLCAVMLRHLYDTVDCRGYPVLNVGCFFV